MLHGPGVPPPLHVGVGEGVPVTVAVGVGVRVAVGVGEGVPHGPLISHLPAFTTTRPNGPLQVSAKSPT